MGQNRSTAVMQRRAPAPDELDYFPTPPWATRALCEWLIRHEYIPARRGPTLLCGVDEARLSCWEPACGAGWMVRPLCEYFWPVRATDVHDYGDDPSWDIWPGQPLTGQNAVQDFTIDWDGPARPADWIVTNPPFRLAEAFISRACRVARHGVAMLVRSAFLEGEGRHARLFHPNPPTWVLQYVERVPMHRGVCHRDASTATAYCWLIWIRGEAGATRLDWIGKCRDRLERAWDYGPGADGASDDDGLPLFPGPQ